MEKLGTKYGGWYVPTNEEFSTLITYLLPAAASGRLREFGRNAINDSKFTTVPGGSRFNNQNDFNGIDCLGAYWTKRVSIVPANAFRFQITAPGMDYNIDFGSVSVSDGNLKDYGPLTPNTDGTFSVQWLVKLILTIRTPT